MAFSCPCFTKQITSNLSRTPTQSIHLGVMPKPRTCSNFSFSNFFYADNVLKSKNSLSI